MTTVEEAHGFEIYCAGKSNRQLYHIAAERLGTLFNKRLLLQLSARPNDFTLKELAVEGENYLGTSGVAPLLDVLRANKLLSKISLVGQGVTDAVLAEILVSIRSHQRLEELDLRHNPEVTDDSTPALCQLLRENRMICRIRLDGTRVPRCAQRKLQQLGAANEKVEAAFFNGSLLQHKRLFMQLDSDGSGSISYGEILAQLALPRIAEVLERKMAAIDDTDAGIRHDGELQADEFLFFIRRGFRRMHDLERLMAFSGDDSIEETIVENWRRIGEHFHRARVSFTGYHRLRICAQTLDDAQLQQVLERALEAEWRRSSTSGAAPSETMPSGELVLSAAVVAEAVGIVVGDAERAFDAAVAAKWGQGRLSPALLRLMHTLFMRSTIGDRNEAALSKGRLPEAEARALLADSLRTETVALQPKIVESLLRREGMDPSVRFTFPQWVALIEENFDAVVYNVFQPKWRRSSESSAPVV